MYPGMGRARGMGFDWGSLIKSAGNIIGNVVGGGSTVSPVPVTTAQSGMIGGLSLGTIILLGVGGFLLYKASKKR